jgi:Zinc carboxypeptidase/Carboxypeptidase regulatory-like domain
MQKRAAAILALATIFAAISGSRAQTVDEPLFRVRIQTGQAADVKTTLETAGYDLLQIDGDTIDLATTRAEWQALQAAGYQVTVIDRGHPLNDARSLTTASADVVPASYLDLAGILARMQQIAAAYSSIARVVDVTATYNTPPTVEGRHLYALKISDNVAQDEDEPAMLIVGTHHAREITTPVIALMAADRLTSQYGSDAQIAAAVNGHEIWIAPVWNPDGYNYVFTTDNLWRKNRRVLSGGVGVDLNRNYPQGWNGPCPGSTTVSSETYKGPAVASEAETQTLMTWSQRERFAKVIDYHSYGREVLYAYKCLSHPFTTWLQQEATTLSQVSGYGGATRLPTADGEHPEWQLARMGAYAFLIETQTEFQPPYSGAVSEATLVWPGILSVLQRPISVSGHVTDARTGTPLTAKIELTNVTFSNGETNGSGGTFGAYHMFLPPGAYDVSFSATGYDTLVKHVTVTAATVLDVQLTPTTVLPPAPQNLRIIQ